MSADQITHGPYSLYMSVLDGNLIIQRQDADRQSTVAFVETREQWDRFVAALESGMNEVDAVHAIDALA